jgi:hypothetical protein
LTKIAWRHSRPSGERDEWQSSTTFRRFRAKRYRQFASDARLEASIATGRLRSENRSLWPFSQLERNHISSLAY